MQCIDDRVFILFMCKVVDDSVITASVVLLDSRWCTLRLLASVPFASDAFSVAMLLRLRCLVFVLLHFDPTFCELET